MPLTDVQLIDGKGKMRLQKRIENVETTLHAHRCSKKYAGFGGEDALKPVIMPCLYRFCKGWALAEEAKAPAARLCKTPVTHLLLDAVLMKRVDGGHAAVSVPLCDMCEEDEATKVLQRLPEEQAVLRPLLCCLAPEEARSHYRSDPRAPRLGTGPRGWR